ncbi:Cytochrome c oxidase subunit 6C [Anthophora quadrimaculata]
MSEGKLAKPQLRNLHLSKLKGTLVRTVGIAVGVGLIYKFLVSNPHHRRVEEFYKTYDPVKSIERMNNAGLMESAPE